MIHALGFKVILRSRDPKRAGPKNFQTHFVRRVESVQCGFNLRTVLLEVAKIDDPQRDFEIRRPSWDLMNEGSG